MKANKKRQTLFLVLMLLLGVMTISGCSEKENTFTVGFDAEFPPYGYIDDDGSYVGFDLDLAQEVADRNGWELVKQPIDWDSKDMELKSGAIDCIWSGFTINGREADYTWSKAYIDNSQVVIVRTEDGLTQLDQLAGKVVAVQTDSSALAAFTGEDATEENKKLCESFADLQQIGDYNSAFMNLEAGTIDAICMDVGVANYQLEKRGSQFYMMEERVSSEQYGIGFKKGNTELRDKVQNTLDEMLKDGTYQEIVDKWGLTDAACLGEAGTDSAYLQDADSGESESFGEKLVYIVQQLSKGVLATLSIFLLTLLFSLPLGLPLTFMRMSRLAPVRWIAKIYISIMRGTPLMLQLLVVFFGPSLIFGVKTSANFRFVAVIIGFSLNYAAYFAEIYRSGIEGIPVGQREAANVLGYSRTQTFWKIIFPQMVKRILPPVTNEVITLVKDTSLAFALAYTEMFTLAKQLVASEASIMPLFIAGLFYYVFNFVVAMIMEKIEKKMQYYR
jgi:polar amino acid transport system substrate-binding protein